MKQFYVHLDSDDSIKYYPDNTNVDFRYNFQETMELKGAWCCALVEIVLSQRENPVTICCDVISHCYINDKKLPVLRRIMKKVQYQEFAHKQYIPVISQRFNSIRIFILNDSGELLPVSSGRVKCTLHFKKDEFGSL